VIVSLALEKFAGRADAGADIPFDSEPAQIEDNRLDKFRTTAMDIEIFNAEYKTRATDSRLEPGRQRGLQIAKV
jgi:hypothetical protein